MIDKHAETLCWKCGNAVPDNLGHGCSWSKSFIPVDGWVAKEVEKSTVYDARHGKSRMTYRVLSCPEYIEDHGTGAESITDDNAIYALANAVVKTLANDYMNALAMRIRIKDRADVRKTLLAVVAKDYRMLYPKQAKRLYGRIHTGKEISDNIHKIHYLERTFESEYIKNICTGNPTYIMNKCRKMYGFKPKERER